MELYTYEIRPTDKLQGDGYDIYRVYRRTECTWVASVPHRVTADRIVAALKATDHLAIESIH